MKPLIFINAESRLWTPRELPVQPWVWYDFSDSSTRTITGQGISEIRPRIGVPTLSLLQGADSARPTIQSQSGIEYANFDGSNDNLSRSSITWITGAMTFVSVYTPTAVNTGVIVANNLTSPSTGVNKALRSNSVFFGVNLTGLNLLANSWNIAVADCTSGISATQRHWGNGNNFVSSAATNDPSVLGTTLFLGFQNSGTFFNGRLDQVLIIPALLSNSDRQKLEGFLAWQRIAWNLPANLPTNHPFKNRPPYVGD